MQSWRGDPEGEGPVLRCPICRHYELAEGFAYHEGLDEMVCERCQFEHCDSCGKRMCPRGEVPEGDVCEECAEIG